jgi:hypothetical protein
MDATRLNSIFQDCIAQYHAADNVDQKIENPFASGEYENILYEKCWVDTVQWHLEDIIRDVNIDPVDALAIKRRIDASNQVRTDMVEQIDDYIFQQYAGIQPKAGARINTETPAWAIDRLSILNLKIYHMQAEVDRKDASEAHRAKCAEKLDILKLQYKYLSQSIDQLLEDLEAGNCIVKTYKQMKMYNDPELNPVLRSAK